MALQKLIGLSAALIATLGYAQTPARPEFDVASVKLNSNCGNGRGGGDLPSNGRLTISCINVRALIQITYGSINGTSLNARQLRVLGGPAWLDSEFYDLNAKAEGGASLVQMAGPMLQALLEDRFKLKIHKEASDTPVYALTVAKGGPRLKAAKEGSCIPIDLNNMPKRPAPGEAIPTYCGGGSMRGNGTTTTVDSPGATLAEFAGRMLANNVDWPIVDRTGLTGRFDIHMEFAHDIVSSGAVRLNGVESPAIVAPASDGSPIFTALQEQLGLKLTPDKSPIDVIVIDSIERPSEN